MRPQTVLKFFIIGSDFNPKDLTEILELEPDESYRKGEIYKPKYSIEGTQRTRIENSWCLVLKSYNVLDLESVFADIILRLNGVRKKLQKFLKESDSEAFLTIKIELTNSLTPSFVLKKETISFMNEFDMELDIDIYYIG